MVAFAGKASHLLNQFQALLQTSTALFAVVYVKRSRSCRWKLPEVYEIVRNANVDSPWIHCLIGIKKGWPELIFIVYAQPEVFVETRVRADTGGIQRSRVMRIVWIGGSKVDAPMTDQKLSIGVKPVVKMRGIYHAACDGVHSQVRVNIPRAAEV